MKNTNGYIKKNRFISIIIVFLILAIISYKEKLKFTQDKIEINKKQKVFKIIEEEKKLIFSKKGKVNYLYIYIKDNLGYSKEFDNFKDYFENKYTNMIIIKKIYQKTNINDIFNFLLKIIAVIILVTIFFIKSFKGFINKETIFFIIKYKLFIFVILLNLFYVFCCSLDNFKPFEIEFKRKIIFSKIDKGYFPKIHTIEILLLEFKK